MTRNLQRDPVQDWETRNEAAERRCETCGMEWYWRQNKAGKWYRASIHKHTTRYGQIIATKTVMPHYHDGER